ncbi:MAG: acetate--CoA ligase family protein [Lautropia sp.]
MPVAQPPSPAEPYTSASTLDAPLPGWLAEAVARARACGRKALDESSGKRILAACGIAVPSGVRVDGPAGLEDALATLRPPFVLKVDSPDLVHKSDVGGVRLGLADAAAVRLAMDGMSSAGRAHDFRIDGFLVEETAPEGHQVVVGGVMDPSFGPMMMVGLGGVFVEVLGDVAFRLCPLSRLDAREMVADLRGAALLAGARGGPSADMSALLDSMLAIGGEHGLLMRYGVHFPQIDVNPLIVGPAGAVAVDARFILPASGDGDG